MNTPTKPTVLTAARLIEQLSAIPPEFHVTAWYDGDRRFFHGDVDDSLQDDGIVELNAVYETGERDEAHCLKCDGVYPNVWAGKLLAICPFCGNTETKQTVVLTKEADA